MGISSMSMVAISPVIYSTNRIDANSLGKVKAISDDLTKSHVDFEGLVEDYQKNTNPLKPGQSANFEDIFNSQMAMSRLNQSRLFE